MYYQYKTPFNNHIKLPYMTTSRKLEKTNDNTEILFKALCNYLPYDLKGLCRTNNYPDIEINCLLVGLGAKLKVQCYDVFGKEWRGFEKVKQIDFKPTLRPLSDLIKEDWKEEVLMHYADLDIAIRVYNSGNIKPNDFTLSITYRLIDDVFTEILINKGSTKETQRHFLQWLCENHFDIDNLIEKRLAIDINTLDNNQQS